MMNTVKNNSLKIFIIFVIALSAVCQYLIIFKVNNIMYLFLMWVPAVSAFIATLYEKFSIGEFYSFKDFFHNLGFRICNVKYIFIGLFLPLVYLLIPYIIYWVFYPNNFAYNGVPLTLILNDCLPTLFIGTLFSFISAIGEEIGWRGYFVPTLKNIYGEKRALFSSSIFWCLWHFPLIIGGSYLSNIPLLYQLPMFILCIFPLGLLCAYLALNTGSVYPSAFLHAAHNNYDQSVFQIITRGDNMFYFVSETGILTIICVWTIVILYKVIKRKKNIK